jgi:hypothetical protein
VVGFHYVTRMVNVFLPNFLLPPRFGPAAKRRLKRGMSRVLSPTLRGRRVPGRSLELLPDAPLPPSAAWAAGSRNVAAAVARAYAAFDAAGARALPPEVRLLVDERLAQWRGEEMGPSREWCERLIGPLPVEQQPAARLALLTALASYQVDDDVVREFRIGRRDDGALVETVAWASYRAARQVGAWQTPAGAAAES